MLQLAGYAACPSNSDEGVKRMVREKGERGYVSDKPFSEGQRGHLQPRPGPVVLTRKPGPDQ